MPNSNPACPESTIESANRRNFIKKATIAGTAIAGASLLGSHVVPQSAASSACCTSIYVKCSFVGWDDFVVDAKDENNGTLAKGYIRYNAFCGRGSVCPNHALTFGGPYTPCGSCCQLNGVHSGEGIASARKCGSPNQYGLDLYTSYTKRVSITNAGSVGIGTCQPSSTLCIVGSARVKSNLVVEEEVGIGTCSPSYPLDVASFSSPILARFQSSSRVGNRSALIQFQNDNTTTGYWNIGEAGKCNSSAPDGSFYFQRQGLSNIPIAINKCGYVGINNTNPERRLCITGRIQASCGVGIGTQTINTSLAVNGSIAAKTRTVNATGNILASDFAVLTSGKIILTLPPASTQNGMMLFIKKTDGSTTLTIDGATGDTIEGKGSVTLTAQYSSYTLISNGVHEWFVIAAGA